ncbi:CRISPR-associated endonuclease Cas1 [uncultured Methanobrevibacter sp.]|uniref:CRISPR-associated endonuclease Cas1 n=1 Tax=uncultured Methanobrevibacter sp. TaxID=253161 RepID=UPI0025EC7ED8|nr:CRISPR-associated endonuclease Cas1 [uncultured Methanobrevibacter sp.]
MRLIIDGFGKSVIKRDNQIVIRENGEELDYFLPKDLKQIIINGKGAITFDAIELLSDNDVDLIAIDWKGNIKYRLSSMEHNNVEIRKQQYYALNDNRSGYLAKKFIESKIKNQKATLTTLAKSKNQKNFLINQRDKLDNLLKALDNIQIKPSKKIRSDIFGIEGIASYEYWLGFRHIISEEYDFLKRSGRGAPDPVNAMLNYSYAILASEVLKSLHTSGLDPYAGFLHSDRYARKSLVFDLVEEFRQQIVDKSVLKLVNRNQIEKDDFELRQGMMYIHESCRKLLIKTILDKLNNDITFNGIKTTYVDLIFIESKNIVDYLLYLKKYPTFYLRW